MDVALHWPDVVLDWTNEAGLIGVGGDLSPVRLVQAYRHGLFPWYDENLPICWWSPDPRGIFDLNTFRPSRRLARTVRSGKFHVTINQACPAVIRACAHRPRDDGTWLIPEMIAAYIELHRLGIVHSVETWRDGELAGGIYGVALGGFFAGESMFYRQTDASKVALVHLIDHLRRRRFRLFDTQVLTEHTANMGAIEIPRTEYLARLRVALQIRTSFLEDER